MEKVLPWFEYEPLVLFPEPKTSDGEEDKRDIDGVGPLGTKVVEQLRDLKGGNDSPERKAIEQILEQVKFVL
jgi:hypothetical protein